MLQEYIVKDDSGSCAVFTEQGSSASQMTAAKLIDVIARLPNCDGQAADAISAYNQVKMEDWFPDCSEFQSQNVLADRDTFWRQVKEPFKGPLKILFDSNLLEYRRISTRFSFGVWSRTSPNVFAKSFNSVPYLFSDVALIVFPGYLLLANLIIW